jgi:hypothetical protein
MSSRKEKHQPNNNVLGLLLVGAGAALDAGIGYLAGKITAEQDAEEKAIAVPANYNTNNRSRNNQPEQLITDDDVTHKPPKKSHDKIMPNNSAPALQETKGNDTTTTAGEGEDDHICKICYEHPANSVVLPCSHQVTCIDCAAELQICCVCRTEIKQVIKVYKS